MGKTGDRVEVWLPRRERGRKPRQQRAQTVAQAHEEDHQTQGLRKRLREDLRSRRR